MAVLVVVTTAVAADVAVAVAAADAAAVAVTVTAAVCSGRYGHCCCFYASVACGRRGRPTSIAMDVALAVAGADAGPLLWQTLQLNAAEATAIAAAFVAFVARPSS